MRTYSANAIVLGRVELGEKDRILTLYTRELGKLSAVAKGSRRPGSKLPGASEPFTYSKMLLASGRDLDIVSQADIRESFPNAKQDLRSVAYAVYMLELVSHFVDERDSNPDLFDTLLSSMYVLESGTDPEITTRHFELKFPLQHRIQPQVGACARCSNEVSRERVAFSPSRGGIVCTNCEQPPTDTMWMPAAAPSYVRALRCAEPHKLKDMKIPKGARRDLARTANGTFDIAWKGN